MFIDIDNDNNNEYRFYNNNNYNLIIITIRCTEKGCFSPAGSPCNDGRFCTLVDLCNGFGACVGLEIDPCSEGGYQNRSSSDFCCVEDGHLCLLKNETQCDALPTVEEQKSRYLDNRT